MNRKKKIANIGLPMLILLFVAGAIVATGGIGYVVLKNKQVTARRDIAKVQQRMAEHRIAIDLHQWEISEILVAPNLPAQLEARQSELVPYGAGVAELIIPEDQETPPGDAVVSR